MDANTFTCPHADSLPRTLCTTSIQWILLMRLSVQGKLPNYRHPLNTSSLSILSSLQSGSISVLPHKQYCGRVTFPSYCRPPQRCENAPEQRLLWVHRRPASRRCFVLRLLMFLFVCLIISVRRGQTPINKRPRAPVDAVYWGQWSLPWHTRWESTQVGEQEIQIIWFTLFQLIVGWRSDATWTTLDTGACGTFLRAWEGKFCCCFLFVFHLFSLI